MGYCFDQLAMASWRAPGLRSFQLLNSNDQAKLEAFFLSFDFDQRRAHFGGGVSDRSIEEHCSTIAWDRTTIIARTGPYCPEALAVLVSLPSDQSSAEFSIVCPLSCDQKRVVAELLALATEIGSLRYRKLVVEREHASPALLALLRDSEMTQSDGEQFRIDLGAAMPARPVTGPDALAV